MKQFLFIFSSLLGGFVFASFANAGSLNSRQLQDLVTKLSREAPKVNVPNTHPDYPVIRILQALRADLRNDSVNVIKILEPIVPQVKYDGLAEKISQKSVRLSVGTVGSYDVWRSLMYYLLGRAYYETNRAQQAAFYFASVAPDSPYFRAALLSRGWCLVKMADHDGDFDQAGFDQLLGKLDSEERRLNSDQRQEFHLQRAFSYSYQGDFEKAMKEAKGVEFKSNSYQTLVSLKWKIMGQSGFDHYLGRKDQLDFKEKTKELSAHAAVLENIPSQDRDALVSHLAAEVYWHLASAYRVEDPDRHRKTWVSHLNRGEVWLKPWVDRTLKQNRPLLSEEALFLSVANLWEQRQNKLAISRLQAIPRLFPQGVYKQDAYQLLADYYYDDANFNLALKYYQLLARFGNPEKAAYGVYKAAWSFYNLERKWAALRHLERLLVFYREKDTEAVKAPGSLAKEASQDMLLMLAELNRYNEALKELEIFKFNAEEKVEIRERLASVYKKIGKFDDSIAIWRLLLKNPSETPRSFAWMKELLTTLLSSGKRRLMAQAIEQYIRRLPDDSGKHEELQRDLVALLLTVHKEARKTDDREIWQASDELYSAFIKVYPKSQEGHIWYYGAQRKESLGKFFAAIGWYQRAASIAGYENRDDAAYSVLKILKESADRLSLNKKTEKEAYLKLATAARWYIREFPKSKHRGLAGFVLLEALYRARDLKEAKDYLAASFKAEKETKPLQDQFLAHNNRLYKESNWTEAFWLADAVVKSLDAENSEKNSAFLLKVKKFRQETSFQAAFKLDRLKKFKEAREWYLRASEVSVDFEISVKSWHNLLLTYRFPKEIKLFEEQLLLFESEYEKPRNISKATQKLLYSIYTHAAKGFDSVGKEDRRADALISGLKHFPEHPKADALRWEAVLIYGSYYNTEKMKMQLAHLLKKQAPVVMSPANRLAVARLYFWNKSYQAAWSALRPLMNPKTASAPIWILLRDLYFQTRREKNRTHDMVREYLMSNAPNLRSVGVLQPLWVRVLDPDFNPQKLANWKSAKARQPAGNEEGKEPHQQLAIRVKKVSQVLNDLSFNKDFIGKYLKTGAPQVTLAALCASPAIQGEAVKRLSELQTPSIKSRQWKDFLKKIDAKVRELKRTQQQEQRTCDTQKEQIVYMPPLTKGKPPLCDEVPCFSFYPGSVKAITDLRRDWIEKESGSTRIPSLHKVHQYLELGAWASAELVAYSSKSVEERSLLLGYIRLVMGDPWNAAPLLKLAAKKARYRDPALLFLARSAWRHGYRRIAARDVKKVQSQKLYSWQKKLYGEMVSDLSK